MSITVWRISSAKGVKPFPHWLLSFCRTHQDETATPTTNRQLAPASSRLTPSLEFRREFLDSSPNCPSSAELWTISRKSLMASYKFRTVETVSYVISVWNIRTILFIHSTHSKLRVKHSICVIILLSIVSVSCHRWFTTHRLKLLMRIYQSLAWHENYIGASSVCHLLLQNESYFVTFNQCY